MSEKNFQRARIAQIEAVFAKRAFQCVFRIFPLERVDLAGESC